MGKALDDVLWKIQKTLPCESESTSGELFSLSSFFIDIDRGVCVCACARAYLIKKYDGDFQEKVKK